MQGLLDNPDSIGAIRKSVPKFSKDTFDLPSWLTTISSKASKKLFEANITSSKLVPNFSLDDIYALGQDCISLVLAVLDPKSSGVVSSVLPPLDLQKELFHSGLPLPAEHCSRLPDLICKEFQHVLLDLCSVDYSSARKRLSLFTKSLPLISLKAKQSVACEEVDAMDKTGQWYQAFVVTSNSKSSLIHFMVSRFAHIGLCCTRLSHLIAALARKCANDLAGLAAHL